MRRISGAVLAVVLAAVVPGCGSASSAEPVAEVRQLPADMLPTSLMGLTVKREDVKETLERGKQSFVDALGLYSFRRDDLLHATLQVSRFSADADVDDPQFRAQLIANLGTGGRSQLRLSDDTVYLTSGQRQNVAVWFRDRYLFVLNVRQDFEQPRGLLRQALRFRP